jgi:hypothetical protein
MVLTSMARRWREVPDEHFVAMLLRVTGSRSALEPDPLSRVDDVELVAALQRARTDEARSTLLPVLAQRPSHEELITAIARRWQEVTDMRLGQLVVNAVRDHRPDAIPHPLFALADGSLLERLGVVTEEERRYVAREPAAARRRWRER